MSATPLALAGEAFIDQVTTEMASGNHEIVQDVLKTFVAQAELLLLMYRSGVSDEELQLLRQRINE